MKNKHKTNVTVVRKFLHFIFRFKHYVFMQHNQVVKQKTELILK